MSRKLTKCYSNLVIEIMHINFLKKRELVQLNALDQDVDLCEMCQTDVTVGHKVLIILMKWSLDRQLNDVTSG